MKNLSFSLSYQTNAEQHPELAYSIDEHTTIFAPMHSTNGTEWTADIEVPDQCQCIRHAYQIVDSDSHVIRTEQNDWRYFQFQHRTDVCFIDAWADSVLSSIYHKTAFEQCIMLARGGERLHMELLSSPALIILHTRPPVSYTHLTLPTKA